MTPFLFIFLLMPDGQFQAAVRTPSGTELQATFADTKAGTQQFLLWAEREAQFRARDAAHSCLAAASGGDGPIYSTAFFEFAHQGTANTFVWSEARLQRSLPAVPPGERLASQMLRFCAREHGVE